MWLIWTEYRSYAKGQTTDLACFSRTWSDIMRHQQFSSDIARLSQTFQISDTFWDVFWLYLSRRQWLRSTPDFGSVSSCVFVSGCVFDQEKFQKVSKIWQVCESLAKSEQNCWNIIKSDKVQKNLNFSGLPLGLFV